jgi:protein O-GlcNAc transferase
MAHATGTPPGRIRLGFVSANFGPHVVAQMMAMIMAGMPRDRFEVIAVHLVGDREEETVIAPYCDRTERVQERRLGAIRQRLADLRLDILGYPDIGMDRMTYLLAYARLAHVQCVMGGHPVTTGIPAIDYFLSSSWFEPDDAQDHYTERLVAPHLLNTPFPRPQPHQVVPVGLRRTLGLAESDRIYACPVTLFKLHPDHDEAVVRILTADPAGHYVVVAADDPDLTPAYLHRLLSRAPHLADRCHVVNRMSLEQFLGFLLELDACLDSFHFGAGSTATFACGIGVPIVTLPAPFLRGRAAFGLYRAMGILDTVARDGPDYVAKALRLANDRVWHASLRARILERCHLVFDGEAGMADLADFFETALAAKRRGEPPIDWPPGRATPPWAE